MEMTKVFAGGVWHLVWLALRRDRLKLPIWLLGISGLLALMIPLLRNVYGDQQSIDTLYQTFTATPAVLFLTGPMDAPTFGAFFTLETILWWGLAIAFMNTLLVTRHTRQNEEIGAQELILSAQLPRHSGLSSALILAGKVNATLIVLIGLSFVLFDAPWSLESTWLYAFAMGAFGLVWAGLAGVVAQLVSSTRSANGILAGLIGLTFVVRGVADFLGSYRSDGVIEPAGLSWLSPFGWLQATRPLTHPDWWPLLVSVGFLLASILLAYWLLTRRDIGSGLLVARSGRLRASRLLTSSFGLTLLLQRNIFVGWLVAVLVMALTIGALVPQMSNVYESSEDLMLMIEAIGGTGELVPSFISAMLAIIVMMVVGYALHGIGRLRSEESSAHLENILALPQSRIAWLARHIIVVTFGSAIMLALNGLILAGSVNLLTDYQLDIAEYTWASISYLPLVLVFVAGYGLLFAVLPRLAGAISWLYYGYMVFMLWIGPILKFDDWVYNLSPMNYLPAVPMEEFAIRPIIVVSTITIALLLIAGLSWRQRDILTN